MPSKPAATMPMPAPLYDATPEGDVVAIPRRKVVAIEGKGAPESAAFQRAVAALYGVAYTLKFARKKSGGDDFAIGPLEARWWAAQKGKKFLLAPRSTWRWQLRIAVPSDVTKAEVAATILAVTTKNGKLEKSADAANVVLEIVPRQRMGRALHVGPYAEESRTFRVIEEAMGRARVKPAFSHIEVYLRDPRRTRPSRLETVLLREAG